MATVAPPSTPLAAHKHTPTTGKCPFAASTDEHVFCPAQPGDTRAPCPALNTMANHGYLPRNGKDVTPSLIIQALQDCYSLSKPLSIALTKGAMLLLDQGGVDNGFCLGDLGRHDRVEHDGSLYHLDVEEDQEYASTAIDHAMLADFFTYSSDGKVMTMEDVARVRVAREASAKKRRDGKGLDIVHAELARGEMAIVLHMMNNPSPELHAAGVALQPRSTLSNQAMRVARSWANDDREILRLHFDRWLCHRHYGLCSCGRCLFYDGNGNA